MVDFRNVVSIGHTAGLYLGRSHLRRPFVITSHLGLLDDLRACGITDYVATIDEHGAARTEFTEEDERDPIDAVVLANRNDPSPQVIERAARYLFGWGITSQGIS